jgi:Ala-tRNA(Pro) deacylase
MITGNEKKVHEVLDKMNIPYESVEHPAVHTCEEADEYIEHLPGIRSKSLFLTNKKRTGYYLIIMDGSKSLNIKDFSDMVDDKHLSFASEERMEEQLATSPGMVSIFALINNKGHNVRVIIDEELMDKKFITFHPNINTVTIQITLGDMLRFIEAMGNPVNLIRLP